MGENQRFEPISILLTRFPNYQPMVTGWVVSLTIVIALLGANVTPARAYENHQMWEKVRVQGKLCMKNHEHYGKSPPWVTKKGAIAYAHRQWEGFTTWEYGKAWGKLRLAVGKRQRCEQSNGRWVCSIIARPCRR